jgi:hypothetical protein
VSKRSDFWFRASGLAFLLAVLGAWLWIEATPAPRIKPPARQALAIDKSLGAQRERKAVIDELLTKGLVRRIDAERAGSVRMSLRPQFYTMDDETRRKYIDVVYAYFFDGSSVNDTVILRDAQHGNEVGQYNPYRGGLKMYK